MNEEAKQLSMDHVQYENTPPGSIFGPGEKPMNALLDKNPPKGEWIDLGAGDGRYSQKILSTCDQLVAFDRDERALAKLERDLQPDLKDKLTLKKGDLTEPLPFATQSFDGAFCASTMHIFPASTIENVVAEMYRVVRPGGKILIDFFYNIRRVMSDGKLYLYPGEISHSPADAQAIIKKCFSSGQVELEEALIEDDFETDNGVVRYVFNGTLILVNATK